MRKDSQETPSIQSLDRGLVILEAVARSSEPVALGELTDLLGIDRSSVFRLANTLKRRGFLANSSGRKDYILGSSIWRLSRQYDWSNMLVEVSDEPLKKLADKTNETAHLAIREGKQALFIHHASVNHVLTVAGQTGEMVPLYCTAHGKALLADLTGAELKAIFGTKALTAYSLHTIVSIEQLIEACAEIKRLGYAADNEEYQGGLRCVAAPIRDRDGEIVGSIGISAPLARFPEELLSVRAGQVCDAAKLISAILSA